MRILLIEDEKMLADNLKTGLIDENFAVDTVANGREGYEIAATENYDAIILDIMLPEMDGITICEKLRDEKVLTPILMLTAKDTLDDKISGFKHGADDYLVKPFSFEELLARIRALIRRSTIKGTKLSVDNLELDPESHIVKRHGREISLTGKEYSLLEYFMHYPNQILTREQILNHVWDYSYDSMSNIIEVLIRRLRNKIDRDFPDERPLFSTVRGLGYRLGVQNEKA